MNAADKAEYQARTWRVYADLLRDVGTIPPGHERDLVRAFVITHERGHYDDQTNCGPGDKLVCEMSFRYGRADLVVFHIDGSATVIEAKDGDKGYNHVVSGIGQAGLYAAQLQMQGKVSRVHRALLWSCTGKPEVDILIHLTCWKAGVIPCEWPHMHKIVACEKAARDAYQEPST